VDERLAVSQEGLGSIELVGVPLYMAFAST
jgi:hypothetical protein